MKRPDELRKIQDQWLRDYIPNVSSVWAEWRSNRDHPRWGGMSMRRRDETLAWYRAKLERLLRQRRGDLPNDVMLLVKRVPGRDDEWLDALED